MAKDFMDGFMKKIRRRRDLNSLSRHTVSYDKYDEQDVQRLLKEMPDFNAHREKLVDSKAGELGYDLWQDVFLSLLKVDPQDIPADDVRPTHLVNKVVMDEAQQLPDHRELRQWTMGDDVGAALAVNTLEPALESIYDRLEEETELARQIMEQMKEQQQLEDEARDLDEMIKQWTEEHPEEDPSDEIRDAMNNYGQMQEQIEQKSDQISQAAQDLRDALEGKRAGIKQSIKQAMGEAVQDAQNQAALSEMWGMDAGSLHRLPADKRLELAARLNNPKLRSIAERFGMIRRTAQAMQRRKVNYARDEIYDVELGNNLNQVLPTEIARLSDPVRKLSFLKDFTQRRLMQYKMRGSEKVAKGGIVYVFDGSGSMSGDREIWSKAVGLALLHIARKQKRPFYAIQFGSSREIHTFDFRDSQNFTPEQVIDFAEFFFGGGTDFMTPLNEAVRLLNEEYLSEGRTKSDIVFATDGQCGVTDDWFAELKKAQSKIGFKIWGINIGGRASDEPLAKICDGSVASIRDLASGEEVRDIFGGI